MICPLVIAFAALSGPLPKLGVVVVGRAGGVGPACPRAPRSARWPCPGPSSWLAGPPPGRHLALAPAADRSPPSPARDHRSGARPGRARRGRRLIAPRFGVLGPLAVLALPFRIPIAGRRLDQEPARPPVPRGRPWARWPGCSRALREGEPAPVSPASPASAAAGTRQARPCGSSGCWPLYIVLYAAPGDLLAGLREGAAEHGLLLRPLHAALRAAAQPALDAGHDPQLPAGHRRAGGGLRRDRLRGVRHQDDHPEPQAGRHQRSAHLLHGQLGLLRPGYLRALPGPGHDPVGGAASVPAGGSGAGRDRCRPGRALGRARPHPLALEPGGAPGRDGGPGRAALEALARALHRGGGDRPGRVWPWPSRRGPSA